MTITETSHELALTKDLPLHMVDAWWRAANYLTVGQIYLRDNALLKRKPRLGMAQPNGAALMSWLRGEELADFDVLSADDCWALLEKAPWGRLAVRADDDIDLFPVNFAVRDRTLYFRSAPGSKLVDIAHSSAVAFEIDGQHRRTHWSVVVHGTAERMSFDTDIQASGVLGLETMTSSAKWNYVRITPANVSGRRFASRRA